MKLCRGCLVESSWSMLLTFFLLILFVSSCLTSFLSTDMMHAACTTGNRKKPNVVTFRLPFFVASTHQTDDKEQSVTESGCCVMFSPPLSVQKPSVFQEILLLYHEEVSSSFAFAFRHKFIRYTYLKFKKKKKGHLLKLSCNQYYLEYKLVIITGGVLF